MSPLYRLATDGPIDRRTLLAGASAAPFLVAAAHAKSNLPADFGSATATRAVDPFIGTDGTGHTFPGPSRPFGMVQPGPDNADGGWDYTSGYQYRAARILGFSQTRASGTGIPELGDVLLMPSGEARDDLFDSSYDKTREVARPGYYAVRLNENAVSVELTSGRRVALHRWRFGRCGRVHVLVDLEHRLRFLDGERVTSSSVTLEPDCIEGVVESANWAVRTVGFVVQFSRPVAEARQLPGKPGEKAPRYVLAFDLEPGGELLAKAALSTVDAAAARRNLTEIPDWDFDAVVRSADAEWSALLARVAIAAPPVQQRIFATALYHLCLHPSDVSDRDGRCRGPTGKVAMARDGGYYSTMSLWDSFRAVHPLFTLLMPERVDGFVGTLLDHYKAQGYLPLWPIWGAETHCMIGNPALPVIADAWAKGFRGFDGQEALAAMIATSTHDHPLSDWSAVDRYGYYPFDKFPNEAVSRTLEAGIGDAATARMAAMLGDGAAAARFGARARNYRRLVDPATRLARGRDSRGAWRTPFDPLQTTSPLGTPGDYTEANAWQYSWTPALHDVAGLTAAMAGRAAFAAMLDRFFTLKGKGNDRFQGQEATIGQYAHGNEPSHHIAWLYAFTDTPWRGHTLVRRIARDFYRDTSDGIMGNEDCGQMSAWYIFATLGFYPVDPSSASYVFGAPLVEHATLTLIGNKRLVIRARGSSARRPYAAVVTLDGRRVGPVVAHRDLANGGLLEFEMRESPAA